MTGEGPTDEEGRAASDADALPRPPLVFTDRRGRELRIQELDGGDLDDLEPMYRGYDPRDRAQGIPPATPAGVRRWLDGLGDALHVVALHDGQPVGHAFLAPDPRDRGTGSDPTGSAGASGPAGASGNGYGDRSAELAIFVDRPYQDAGIGTRLMRALLGLGAGRGIRRVWLVVQRSNGPAVRLYRKTGFEVAAAGRAELEMERELEAAES